MRRLTQSPAVKLWSYQVLAAGVAQSSASNTTVEPPTSASPQLSDKNETNFSKYDFYRYLDVLRLEMNANFKSLELQMSTNIRRLEEKMDTNIKRLEDKMDINIKRIDSGMNWLKVGIGALGAMGLFIASMLHQNQLQLKQDLGNQFNFMNQRFDQIDRRFEKTDQQLERINQRLDTLTGLIQSQSSSSPGSRSY